MYALVFPGQGAQKIGMGRELFEAFPSSKAVFQEAVFQEELLIR